MSSEAITRNDLTAILNEVLPPTASEYRKLLWTNPNPSSTFGAQTISIDLSDYDEVEVLCRSYATTATYFTSRAKVGNGNGILFSQTGYGNPVRIYGTQRKFTPTSAGVAFEDGLDFSATADNAYCVPYQIYGIMYDHVAPPQVEIADYVVEQGTEGMWRYRKWNSGIAECWGYTSAESIACTTQWGSAYYSSPRTYNFPSGLFLPYPTVNALLYDNGGLGWITINTWSESNVNLYISEPISNTRNMQICFQVSGRWK